MLRITFIVPGLPLPRFLIFLPLIAPIIVAIFIAPTKYAALIGKFALNSADWMFILGAVAVIGHIFPIYTKFKGGN